MVIIVLIYLVAAWGFLGVLVFATGAVTVGVLGRLTRNRVPAASILVLVSATVTAIATHLTTIGLLGGYEVLPGADGTAGFLRRIDWSPVLRLAGLFATASLVPGFLWCIRPANIGDDQHHLARETSAALDTYFLVAPVVLPAGWFVMAFLM